MANLKKVIREGVSFGWRELILSTAVFAYLAAFGLLKEPGLQEGLLPAGLQFFFILLETYLTTLVYSFLNDSFGREKIPAADSARRGGFFFGRVLLYKALAGFFAVLMLGFAYGMVDLVKAATPVRAGLVMSATILWLVLPAGMLVFTLMTPLVIVVRDLRVAGAMRESFIFTRKHLLPMLLLTLMVLPAWVFAFFLLKVYNETVATLYWVTLYFISFLEIVTVKLFVFFYRINCLPDSPVTGATGSGS